jgi:HNH endonuclease
VHHVVFRSHGGEDTMENLCTLCASCHDGVHIERELLIEFTKVPGVFKFTRLNGWRPK